MEFKFSSYQNPKKKQDPNQVQSSLFHSIGFIIVAIALGSRMPVFAVEETDWMMCDGGVVRIGDTKLDVQDKCGQPDNQSINEWVYEFGPAQPVYSVIFKDGKVVRILEKK